MQAEALTNDIPVIVVGERELVARARIDPGRYGGQRFLPTPLDLDRLVAAIDELIGTA